MIIVHAYTMIIVHACIMIIVHTCAMIVVHVSCPTWLMFGAFEVGGSSGRSHPGTHGGLGGRQGTDDRTGGRLDGVTDIRTVKRIEE